MRRERHVSQVGYGEHARAAFNRRFRLKVANMLLRAHEQIHAAEYARKAKLVLALEIGCRAPLEHDYVERGYIELARCMRYLAVSRPFAVYVHIKETVYALEIKVIFLR